MVLTPSSLSFSPDDPLIMSRGKVTRVGLTTDASIPPFEFKSIAWEWMDDAHGSFYSDVPSRLTCYRPGKVLMKASLIWQNIGRLPYSVRITKNGIMIRDVGYQRFQGPVLGSSLSLALASIESQPGDYFEVWVRHETEGDLPIRVLAHDSTSFEIGDL